MTNDIAFLFWFIIIMNCCRVVRPLCWFLVCLPSSAAGWPSSFRKRLATNCLRPWTRPWRSGRVRLEAFALVSVLQVFRKYLLKIEQQKQQQFNNNYYYYYYSNNCVKITFFSKYFLKIKQQQQQQQSYKNYLDITFWCKY